MWASSAASGSCRSDSCRNNGALIQARTVRNPIPPATSAPMKRSTDRILTTHVGSLIRPPRLQELLRARQKGEGFDPAVYDQCLTESVAGVVQAQADAGIDVVSDG